MANESARHRQLHLNPFAPTPHPWSGLGWWKEELKRRQCRAFRDDQGKVTQAIPVMPGEEGRSFTSLTHPLTVPNSPHLPWAEKMRKRPDGRSRRSLTLEEARSGSHREPQLRSGPRRPRAAEAPPTAHGRGCGDYAGGHKGGKFKSVSPSSRLPLPEGLCPQHMPSGVPARGAGHGV